MAHESDKQLRDIALLKARCDILTDRLEGLMDSHKRLQQALKRRTWLDVILNRPLYKEAKLL